MLPETAIADIFLTYKLYTPGKRTATARTNNKETKEQYYKKLSQTLQLALHKAVSPLYCDKNNYHLDYLEYGQLETYPYINTIDGLIPLKKAQNNKQTLLSFIGDGKSEIYSQLLNIYQARGQNTNHLNKRGALFKIDKDYSSTNPKNLFLCSGSEEMTRLNNQLTQIFTELRDSDIIGFHPGSKDYSMRPHYFIADPNLRQILINLESKNKKIKRSRKFGQISSTATVDGVIKKFDVNKKRRYKPGKDCIIRASLLPTEVITHPNTHIHHLNGNRNNGYPENLYMCDNKTHSQLHFQIDSTLSFLIKKGVISFFPENLTEAKLSQEKGIKPHYFINLPYLRNRLREAYPEPRSQKPFIDLLSMSYNR